RRGAVSEPPQRAPIHRVRRGCDRPARSRAGLVRTRDHAARGVRLTTRAGREGGMSATDEALAAVRDVYVPIKAEAAAKLPDPRKAEPKRRLVSLADFAPKVKVPGGAIPTEFETLNTAFR